MLKNFKSSEMKKNTLSGVSALFLGVSSLMAADAVFSSSVMAMEDTITEEKKSTAEAEKARLEALLAKAQGPKGAASGQAAKDLYALMGITPTGKSTDVSNLSTAKADPSSLSNWSQLRKKVGDAIVVQNSLITAYAEQERNKQNGDSPATGREVVPPGPNNPNKPQEKITKNLEEILRTGGNNSPEIDANKEKIAQFLARVKEMLMQVGSAQNTGAVGQIASRFQVLRGEIDNVEASGQNQQQGELLGQVTTLEGLIKSKQEELEQAEKAAAQARQDEKARTISHFVTEADQIIRQIPDKVKQDDRSHVQAFDTLKSQLPRGYESDGELVDVVQQKLQDLTSKLGASIKAQEKAEKKQAADDAKRKADDEAQRRAAEQERFRQAAIRKQQQEAEDAVDKKVREEGHLQAGKNPSASGVQKSGQPSLKKPADSEVSEIERMEDSEFLSAKSHLTPQGSDRSIPIEPQAIGGRRYQGTQSALGSISSGDQRDLPEPTLTQSVFVEGTSFPMGKKGAPAKYSPDVSQVEEVRESGFSRQPVFSPQRPPAPSRDVPKVVSYTGGHMEKVLREDRESALEKFNQLYGKEFGRSIDEEKFDNEAGQPTDFIELIGGKSFSHYSTKILSIFQNANEKTDGLFFTLLNKGLDKQLVDSQVGANGGVDFSRIERLDRIIKALPEVKDFSESWNSYYGDLEAAFKPDNTEQDPEG